LVAKLAAGPLRPILTTQSPADATGDHAPAHQGKH